MNLKHCFILIIVFFTIAMAGCNSRGQSENRLPTDLIQNPNTAGGTDASAKLPKIQFDKEFHDFGRVIQGEQVSFGFKFKNTGDSDLIISRVSSSCGCTVPSYPTKPIGKGGEGVITVQFDSKGRRGNQVKTVTVLANTQPNSTQLTIQANVITPETMN